MLLVFSAFTLVPALFAYPHLQQVWGGNTYNVAAVAAAWIFAAAAACQDENRLASLRASALS
jgi:hypothetical protein